MAYPLYKEGWISTLKMALCNLATAYLRRVFTMDGDIHRIFLYFFLHRIERWKIKTSKLKASHGIRGLYRCTIIVQQGGETKQSKGCKQVSCFGTKACPPRVCGGLTLVQNSRGTEQLSEICLTTSQTKQVLLSSFSRCVRNPYFPRTVLALL
jgi:hypothetical protein